jgi:DNA-binding HxlR family transcriptional regulator
MGLVNADRPLNKVVNIVGGRWRALIIYFLFNRTLRFSDLEKEIPGISQRMLSLDLRKLEKEGILLRTVIDDAPVKVEYKLTLDGASLSLMLHQLHAWEQNSKIKQPVALETLLH